MDKLIKTTEIIEKKLEKFYELHLNCQINLTAIKEREEFYLKHYYDSIYYFQQSESPCGSLADIGSGGGFPGIVLGIFYPVMKCLLIRRKVWINLRINKDFNERRDTRLHWSSAAPERTF